MCGWQGWGGELVGGHLVSALVGVTCQKLIQNPILASSLAIAVAMLLMHHLRCIHPPGGATAVTAVIGGEQVEALGYVFVILPVFFNSIILKLKDPSAHGTFSLAQRNATVY